MKNYISINLLALTATLFFSSCASIPKGAEPFGNFDADSYLGKWYEIARLDHRFERNLNNVTAEYSFNDNGTIRVLNSGYNYEDGKWESAEGKAKFRGDTTVAALKVSFFGPFYSGYNVIALDDNYKYALVAGKNLKYLWILSRTTTIPEEIKNDFLETAERIGYDSTRLVWVEHDKKRPTVDD